MPLPPGPGVVAALSVGPGRTLRLGCNRAANGFEGDGKLTDVAGLGPWRGRGCISRLRGQAGQERPHAESVTPFRRFASWALGTFSALPGRDLRAAPAERKIELDTLSLLRMSTGRK